MEIKENHLAIFLLVAFIFSMLTVLLNFTSFGATITGAVTASGEANLTIASNTAIANQVANLNFGSGYVDSSCTECAMDSNSQHNQTGTCCIGFINVSSGFLLENTGNTNLSVNFTCSGNCTAAQFIGTGASFEIKVTSNSVAGQSGESGAADTGISCANSYGGIAYKGWNYSLAPGNDRSTPEGEYNSMDSGAAAWLCGNATNHPLNGTNTHDAAVVDINVSIPSTISGSGVRKSATFTFNGVSE